MASLALDHQSQLEDAERDDGVAFLEETPENRRRRLRRRKERQRAGLIGNLKIASVCIAVICLGLYGPNLYKLQQIRTEIRGLQAQCDEWRQRNLEVMAEIEYARSDAFVRQAARERLGLVDQGTTLYIARVPETGGAGDDVRDNQGTDRGSQSYAMSLRSKP